MADLPVQPEKIPQKSRIIDINIPVTYANGLQVSLTNADIAITLISNGQPFQILNMPYATAKSLVEILDRAIKKYEADTGTKIIGSKEAQGLLKKI